MTMMQTKVLAGSACFVIFTIVVFNVVYYQRGPIESLHEPMSDALEFFDSVPSDIPAPHQLNPCEPVKHLFYGKIEKTGSSTMQTMLSRFAIAKKLTVLAATKPYVWHINSKQPRGKGWIIGPDKGADKADVLVNHMIYDPPFITKFLRNDTFKFTLIREPVSWFLSAFHYYPAIRPRELHKYAKAEDLVNDAASFFVKRHYSNESPSYYHLGQLFWLGLNYSRRGDINYVTEYVETLAKQLDFVMLNDHYDASIVLLRRKLCWNYKDMFYNKQVQGPNYRRTLTPQATQKLLSAEYNLGDKILYDHFNNTWWQQDEVKDPLFWQEVQDFKDILMRAKESCKRILKSQLPSYRLNGTSTIPDMELTQADCRQIKNTGQGSIVQYAHGN